MPRWPQGNVEAEFEFLLFSSTGLGFVISALLLLICTQMQAGAGTKMVSVSQISCWHLVPGTRYLVPGTLCPSVRLRQFSGVLHGM